MLKHFEDLRSIPNDIMGLFGWVWNPPRILSNTSSFTGVHRARSLSLIRHGWNRGVHAKED